jgi:hypothetical protein
MEKFFLHLLNKIEILTGIRQLERLQDKPEQLSELVQECSKAAIQFPLKEDILKSVLMDAVSSDQDFIGLNVKWVRKVLNLYCQVHGVVKGAKEDKPIDLELQYNNMIIFWQSNPDKDPNGDRAEFAKENLNRVKNGDAPVDDIEGIKIMAGMYAKQIEGTILSQPQESKYGGSRLREHFEQAGIIEPQPKEEPPAPTFFCVMPKKCAQQCERCKSEQEILNVSPPKLEDKNV